MSRPESEERLQDVPLPPPVHVRGVPGQLSSGQLPSPLTSSVLSPQDFPHREVNVGGRRGVGGGGGG